MSEGSGQAAPRSGRWVRRARHAGVGLLVIGLLGSGGAVGWFVRGWLDPAVVVERPVRLESRVVSRGSLPNVLGLGVDEARQAYADAGVDPGLIGARETPYLAREGTVIEQHPSAATRFARSARVELVIAAPATMPDLRGVAGDAARRRLTELGVGARTVVRADTSVEPGEVVRTEPPSGEPAVPQATLVVSEPPSSVNLADLRPVRSECRLDAELFECVAGPDPVLIEYEINDGVGAFEATVALGDEAAVDAKASLVVRGEDGVVEALDVRDEPREVKVRLPGGDRLVLVVHPAKGSEDRVPVVLRDARLVGARSRIDALANPTSP